MNLPGTGCDVTQHRRDDITHAPEADLAAISSRGAQCESAHGPFVPARAIGSTRVSSGFRAADAVAGRGGGPGRGRRLAGVPRTDGPGALLRTQSAAPMG